MDKLEISYGTEPLYEHSMYEYSHNKPKLIDPGKYVKIIAIKVKKEDIDTLINQLKLIKEQL